MIYWFTGQPGAGKTTLARAVAVRLREMGRVAMTVDGDELRRVCGLDDYSALGRVTNVLRAMWLCEKISNVGGVAVAALVSPKRSLRETLKRRGDVVEIYAHTTSIRGKEKNFVAGYEPPLKGFVNMDTTNATVEECVEKILKYS